VFSESEYLPLGKAAAIVGRRPSVIRKWLEKRGVAVFRHPTDARSMVVRRDDLDLALTPRQITPNQPQQ
jgi:hypothetical protein